VPTANHKAILAALVSPPERLGEVPRYAIFHIPLLLLWRAISQNRYYGENGQGEKDKWRTHYADPGGRWRGWAEAKPSANGWFFKLYFFHAVTPSTVAPDIYVVRVVSIPPIHGWYQ
jgi:hypothetical protein